MSETFILTYFHTNNPKKVYYQFVVCLFVCLYCRFLLVINFIHISVYMSIPIAQFSTPPSPSHRCFPPLVSIRLFSTSVSQLLPCKLVHLYHFSRFHIHALMTKDARIELVFLFLTHFTLYDSLQIHPCPTNDSISFLFMAE